jgi:hypothetical protein
VYHWQLAPQEISGVPPQAIISIKVVSLLPTLQCNSYRGYGGSDLLVLRLRKRHSWCRPILIIQLQVGTARDGVSIFDPGKVIALSKSSQQATRATGPTPVPVDRPAVGIL